MGVTLPLDRVQVIVEHLLTDGSREGLILGDELNVAMGASARRRDPAAHHHEEWQVQESAKGGTYCTACGATVVPPPLYAVVTARMPQYVEQERFDAGTMQVRLFGTEAAAQEWAVRNPDYITEVVEVENQYHVFRQDHTGRGVLQSEHPTHEQAMAAATEGKRTSAPSLIRANIWYVASPGTTGFDITYPPTTP